jgi:hypothetical protein
MRSLLNKWRNMPKYLKDDTRDRAKFWGFAAIFLPATLYMAYYEYNYDYSDSSASSGFK